MGGTQINNINYANCVYSDQCTDLSFNRQDKTANVKFLIFNIKVIERILSISFFLSDCGCSFYKEKNSQISWHSS